VAFLIARNLRAQVDARYADLSALVAGGTLVGMLAPAENPLFRQRGTWFNFARSPSFLAFLFSGRGAVFWEIVVLGSALVASTSVFGTPITKSDPRPLSAQGLKQFDRQWAKLQRREPNLSSRETYQFLLNAAAHGWRPEEWASVIDLVESMHDHDPASATYGNYRWYWHESAPDDRNAVEFCMQLAGLTWTLYHDRFPAAARDKLTAAIALGAEGVVRQKVDVGYTNIFLMRLANCILMGEQTNRPDLTEKGRAWFDEWLAYTRANGIHEYSSPTYYAVDLEDLGILTRYALDSDVREKAQKSLRLLWTDIAANWFEPHGALGGAHSRDYDFLTGHGELDRHLILAGWIPGDLGGETRLMLTELAYMDPPPDVRASVGPVPRMVSQAWGPHAWERSTHYLGRHFSFGSAGASYNAQDKILALAFSGGPKRPLANFSFDYRNDPYGTQKIMTSGSHPKLTHLEPFVASVQRGAEVLMVASVDPAKTPNPAGKNQPMQYAGVNANLVLPDDVELWGSEKKLSATGEREQRLGTDPLLYVRDGDMAVAIWFATSRAESGGHPELLWINDGREVHAQRLNVQLAAETPHSRMTVALWMRAAEGLDDAGFAAFRRECDNAMKSAKVKCSDRDLDLAIMGREAPLHIRVDLQMEKRLKIDGADPMVERGILNVNSRDIGAAILK
jgi:hypothetical protein